MLKLLRSSHRKLNVAAQATTKDWMELFYLPDSRTDITDPLRLIDYARAVMSGISNTSTLCIGSFAVLHLIELSGPSMKCLSSLQKEANER